METQGEMTQVPGAGWRGVTGRRRQKLHFCEGESVAWCVAGWGSSS